MKVSVDGNQINSSEELQETVEAVFRGMSKGLSQPGSATRAYEKVGEQGAIDMLKPIFKADLTVDEAEQLFEVLKVIIKRAKVRSIFPENTSEKPDKEGGE